MTGDDRRVESRADSSWRRRRFTISALVIATAACVGAATVAVAVALDDDDTGRPPIGVVPDRGQSLAEYVACARVIATGDIVHVRAHPENRLEITLDVRAWIKPSHGQDTVRLDIVDDSGSFVENPWQPHKNVLVVVPTNRRVESDAYLGNDRRATRNAIERELHRATATGCPPVWRSLNQ